MNISSKHKPIQLLSYAKRKEEEGPQDGHSQAQEKTEKEQT